MGASDRWGLVLVVAGVSFCAGGALGAEASPATAPPAHPPAQRAGPPTFYMQDIERYDRSARRPPERRCPIRQQPITRETYYRWLADSGHFAYADQADRHGRYGPRHFLPVLARYVQTRDQRFGRACITMLKSYHAWMKQEVARAGWHSHYMDEPGYLGLYRRYLTRGRLLDESRESWFRELVLFMNRHVHVWGTKPTFWRGPMHRAQGEGAMKRLAAEWYPDAPEAKLWRRYAETVYQDFWAFRDNPPNDTGYYFGILLPLALRAELLGEKAMFADAGMKPVWSRMMHEVSPDGSVAPYGAHGGWNATAGVRILLLELAAARTNDGRYRFVAHRLMNYLLYQQANCFRHHILAGPETTEKLAAAYLVADDSIRPVQPDPASRITYRKETLRVRNHRDKRICGRFLKDLDPAPDKAHVCCGLVVTDKTMPSKLVLRSGWKPGDLFALVDVFARHDPLNVGGIVGLTRWGACLTNTISAKGESDENRLIITDPTGKAPRRLNRDPNLSDPYYQDLAVPDFHDLPRATFATVTVANCQGFPVTHTRELAFIKNRLLVVRDVAAFEAAFEADVAVVFNTQNVGPAVGPHWANTFMSEPLASRTALRNPPVDLLVYFTPRPACRLRIVDRTAADPRTAPVPAQLRYAWRGAATAGSRRLFTQVLYPHPPRARLAVSNAAGDRRNRTFAGDRDADGIEVLQDTLDATVLRLRLDAGRVEYVVVNPSRRRVAVGGLATDARFAYVDVAQGKDPAVAAVGASSVQLDGREILRRDRSKPRSR